MSLKRPQPLVYVVPSGLLIEFFAVARLASRNEKHVQAAAILRGLRCLRPDVPEFSAYLSFSLRELGLYSESLVVLDEYAKSDFDPSSLVMSCLARYLYEGDDVSWLQVAEQASALMRAEGGGGEIQRELLKVLPGFEPSEGADVAYNT